MTDRQTDRWMIGQMNRHTEGQMDDKEMNSLLDGPENTN